MTLHRLQLQNFRNFPELNWEVFPGLNILEGENAQGKTNLLEAIYCLAHGKSFRSSDLNALIAFEAREARVQGAFWQRDLKHEVSFRFSSDEKEVQLLGKTQRGFQKIHQLFRVLLFVPESTSLLRTSADTRRRYFDQAISLHSPSYSTLLLRYTRVVRQRNRLLEMGSPLPLLEPFNQQWCELAVLITLERFEYLRRLLPVWRQRLQQFAQDCGELEVQWKTSVGLENELPSLFLTAPELNSSSPKLVELRSLFQKKQQERFFEEQRRAYTLVGPHRDDLLTFLKQKPAREVASQGQQRMLVIALKLAEADLILERFGAPPIFLLDDIGSELDREHSQALLEALQKLEAQTFLTTADVGRFQNAGKVFRIREGRIQ